ncbi:MAG: alpha/beta fold hydrolase [Azonexus sp.]|nr:alpha/beta fold hydrolase [Azonexus sp.]
MLSASLLLWLAAETACWLALARYLEADWDSAALIALGGLLGLRTLLYAPGWFFASRYASPAPPLALAARLSLIAVDYLAFLFTVLIVLPFGGLWMPADRPPADRRRVALLAHGNACNRNVWWLLRRRLEAAGYAVAAISLPPYASLGQMVPPLRQRIEEISAAVGNRKLILIGHSMGGLVCRSYLARHGDERVERLLTLATPHTGSELARFGWGRSAREMAPDSLWLRDMAGEQLHVPTFSLRNPWDNYVMPQDNQRLPGARDVELPPVGHFAMLYDRRVAALLLRLCQE